MNEPTTATRTNKLTLVKEKIRDLHVKTDVRTGVGFQSVKLGMCSQGCNTTGGSVVKNM
jgi:hypothetical protein